MRHFIRSGALAIVLLWGAGLAGAHSAEARSSFSLSIGVPLGYGGGYYGGGYWGGGYWGGHGRYGPRRDSFGFGFSAPIYYRPYYHPYEPIYRPVYARPYYRPYSGPIYSLGLFPPYVGDALNVEARGYYYDAYRQAMAAPVGEAIEWGAGSARGTVETTRDGWAGSRYCREFRQDVAIDGQTQEAYGTACRTPSGDWQLVQNQE